MRDIVIVVLIVCGLVMLLLYFYMIDCLYGVMKNLFP